MRERVSRRLQEPESLNEGLPLDKAGTGRVNKRRAWTILGRSPAGVDRRGLAECYGLEPVDVEEAILYEARAA